MGQLPRQTRSAMPTFEDLSSLFAVGISWSANFSLIIGRIAIYTLSLVLEIRIIYRETEQQNAGRSECWRRRECWWVWMDAKVIVRKINLLISLIKALLISPNNRPWLFQESTKITGIFDWLWPKKCRRPRVELLFSEIQVQIVVFHANCVCAVGECVR